MQRRLAGLLRSAIVVLVAGGSVAAANDEAGLEFFEKQVRPILVARCYECHSGKTAEPKGGLRVDSLAALKRGGDTGPAVLPGKTQDSLLIDAINYGELYQMPPKSKMPANEIAVLTRWVEMGAPWPEEAPVVNAASASEFNLAQRKADHWCWQPLTRPALPTLQNPQSQPANPIDVFILARLQPSGLALAPPASRRTLLRRAYFDLIGLPPTPAQVEAFLSDDSPQAFEKVVSSLLDSPQFGERWGRHWLDLVRYAESRGHEFDYNVPNAFEYRDYVIRALNADVPYDQFVVEHIAGDLLEQPRLHPTESWNESIVATGFWFLGEWIHSPVDIRKDECDRVDNQLDVFSKAFLGLTVTCARCHDHKFDAISQRDYYALSGYLRSSSYRLTRFETWDHDRRLMVDLAALDAKHQPLIAAALAQALTEKAGELAAKLAADVQRLQGDLGVEDVDLPGATVVVDYATAEPSAWWSDGPTFGSGPVRPGQLVWSPDPSVPVEVATYGAARRDPSWKGIGMAAPSEGDQGRLSGWLRAGRTLKTPTWTLTSGQVHYLIEGAGHVYAAVDSHAMLNGPLHGELAKDTGGNSDLPARWITHDLSRYAGHLVHLEFSPKGDEDFRLLKVVEGERPAAPTMRPNQLLQPVAAAAEAGSAAAVVSAARKLIEETVNQLAQGQLTADDQVRDRAALANWLLAQIVHKDSMPAAVSSAAKAWNEARGKLVAAFRPNSRLAMAIWEGNGVDDQLLIRGNHKTVGPIVPRRMLEAVNGALESESQNQEEGRQIAGSGRLELARALVNPANPFTARVMVNRVWQHLLGRGIVPSVDNFGVLGQPPTHPELLDHLAMQFIQDGWSVKRLIRSIMLSDTYQQASAATGVATEVDPQNLLVHRQNVKRLEGEVIRDSILAISGRLDRTQFGPSVPVHLTPFMQGRGRPAESGPLDGNGRRSMYVSIRRNFLSPMMLAFDTPIPFSTVGRRNVSNVPAQALILMNDPFVVEQSRVWAKKLLADRATTSEARIRSMYLQAFGREPTAEESAAAIAFVAQQAAEYGVTAEQGRSDERVWSDLGHVIWNVKEFVLVE